MLNKPTRDLTRIW